MTQSEYLVPQLPHPWRVVEEFRRLLRDAYGQKFKGLILFGSCARGENDAESDIDLLVLFQDQITAQKERPQVSGVASELCLKHGIVLGPLTIGEKEYQKGRSPFFLNVKREGILILPEEGLEMKPEVERLLEMARTSLRAAQDLFERENHGYYGFVAARAYYAMFYAAEAALLSKGLSYSRHSGVIGGFGQHFTRPGLVPSGLQSAFQDAFHLRNLGDYSTEPFPRESAEAVLRDARSFLDSVEAYLKESLEGD